MTNGLQIISPRLLIPEMGVQACIPGCPRQILPIFERNMLAIRRLVALREAKINNVNSTFCGFRASNQKVVRLDVSVNDSFIVYGFDALDHLHADLKARLQVKLTSTFLKEVLETLTQEIHNHYMKHFAILSLLVADKM